MNGRLYDPAVGRFLNADPVIQNAGNTQHYNRYSYCLNNPLKFTDPSGYTMAQMWTSGMSNEMNNGLSGWGTSLNGGNSSGSNGGGGSGGSAGGSSIGSYSYDWNSGSYNDGWGNDVSYYDVYNNYIIPNGTSLQGNTNLNSISFGERNGVDGVWYQTGYTTGDSNSFLGGSNSSDFQSNVKNTFTAFTNGKERDWFDKTQIGMESYGLVNSSKEQLFNFAAKSDVSINNLKYVKGVRFAGNVLVVGGVAITGYQAYNDIQKGNYYSAATRAVVLSIGLAATTIPFAGWGLAGGIGLADAIWGDQFYGWVELNLTK